MSENTQQSLNIIKNVTFLYVGCSELWWHNISLRHQGLRQDEADDDSDLQDVVLINGATDSNSVVLFHSKYHFL